MLFEKNSQEELPIASLTKLMTALVVFSQYDLSSKVTIDQAAMDQEGEQGDLKLGQTLTVRDLLYITLIESSNRAAYALAEPMGQDAFVAHMNDYAANLGLNHTHFQDTSGLNPYSYSTTSDLLKLAAYLFKNYPLFREITRLKEYHLYQEDGSLHHTLVNTNQMLGEDGIISGKTGFTTEAQGCFMAIKKIDQKGSYIISIVLGSQDRFGEMKKILDWEDKAYVFDLPGQHVTE
jgi:D-alanyl-D-alanine carboxypeptidase (penicillin-binding protein 5/6)